MSLTNYTEDAILNHIRGGAAFAQPAALYYALFSTATADDGTGTELVGNGYARQASTWGAPSPAGTIQNSAQIQFQASGGNWVAATHGAIFDALSGGNMIAHGPLSASKQIDDGEIINFAAGDLTLTID